MGTHDNDSASEQWQNYNTGDKNKNVTTAQKYIRGLEIHFYMHSLTDASPRLNPLVILRSNLFVVSRRVHNLENNNTTCY